MEEIKSYWYKLQKEYESKYNEKFMKDFEKSKGYLQKMESYLQKRLDNNPFNIDAVCTLASVRLTLRYAESDCGKLLEDFLDKFFNSLDDIQKSRLYTNIAFYEDNSPLCLKYLNMAYKLKSPFIETYRGLGEYHFSQYQDNDSPNSLFLGKKYYKIAMDMTESYEDTFSYAVCLYELKEYKQARDIFTDLLRRYPNRMRLLLSIAYCEIFLGNKESAKRYLEQVKPYEDSNYSLNTDNISECDIFDAYYVMDEYDIFLKYLNDEDVYTYYSISDWDYYFYALWINDEKDFFNKLVEENRKYFKDAVKEAKEDDDYESTQDKEETLKAWERDACYFEEMISRIKSGIKKPKIKLSLYPEYSCYLTDCVEHKF